MSNIPSSKIKIQEQEVKFRAAVTTATGNRIGGSVNWLIDAVDSLNAKNFTKQVFTSNGSWVCPANITSAIIIACGGGGGGGGSASTPSGTNPAQDGASGGNGSVPTLMHVSVTPATSYAVVIGSGGSGGAADTNGSKGSNTTFIGGSLSLTFEGAEGGKTAKLSNTVLATQYAGIIHSLGGEGGDKSTTQTNTAENGFQGMGSIYSGRSNGGAGGFNDGSGTPYYAGGGGGGGGSGYSIGGAGGKGGESGGTVNHAAGSSASANSGGGGGGGGGPRGVISAGGLTGAAGGNGGSGILIIYYF